MKPQFTNATDEPINAQDLAARLPYILQSGNTAEAFDIISRYRQGDDWQPEAMMLLNTGDFSFYERERMAATFFPGVPITNKIAKNLCEFAGMIARIGYSFPEWRFLAQGFGNEGSLFERHGLERLKRQNDVRDPSLPHGHPDRDDFGAGYALIKDNIYLEYRRAYILYSDMGDDPVSIVIRNNSFFFGRDRLREPAYISWEKLSIEELQKFDHHSYSEDGPFKPVNRAMETWSTYDASCNAIRALDVLQCFDWENELIRHWLFGREGIPHMKAFMNEAITRNENAGKGSPPFYIAQIDRESAPWKVWKSIPATRETLAKLDHKDFKTMGHYALLSGANGDFPVRPEPATTSARYGSHPSAPDGP